MRRKAQSLNVSKDFRFKKTSSVLFPLLLALILNSLVTFSATIDSLKNNHGQLTLGKARFTVLTPYCIRMEWGGGAKVDMPTLFAFNRNLRCEDTKINYQDSKLTINTGAFTLVYYNDGKEFNKNNLNVFFKNGDKDSNWNPESKSGRNLGGTVPTLDTWNGPKPVNDGLLSREGWYLIDDSASPLLTQNGIEQRKGSVPFRQNKNGGPLAAGLDQYLFVYGNNFKDALKSLAAVSGKVAMPRKHIFGSWYCRWYDYTSDDFRQLVREYGEHDFPLDIMVMDMGWHTQKDAVTGHGHSKNLGWTGYSWNKKLIPDPEALLSEFKKDGIFVTLNDHPHDGMRSHEDYYSEFNKMLPKETSDNPPFYAGAPRYMDAFFQWALGPLEKQGVDFWWVDWQQDYVYNSVLGVPGLNHLPWLNHLYFKNSEKSGRRGQGFSRWGGWGGQRYPIQFSGDADGTWEMLTFQIPFTANSGNAGCFFWAHDLGGFTGKRNPEMFTRWVQFGALSATLRVHSAGSLDRRPWLWGEPFESSMRSAYHLRSTLFPYIYTSVRQCYDQSISLLRPMYLEYPDLETAYSNPQQYMFGESLIVAPVNSPGKGSNYIAEQKVWFPKGAWFNLLSGEKYVGDTSTKVKASIEEIPVFVKAGVPIPMQPYTSRMSTTPLSKLIIRIYPGENGHSELYEDDGQSQGYMKNSFATTTLNYERKGNSVVIKISPVKGVYQGQLTQRSYQIELPCSSKAEIATANGKKTSVKFIEDLSMNVVTTPELPISQSLEVVVKTNEVIPLRVSSKIETQHK
jgi:alpha-glucosidase (family GH31 glycosyl hydrolase)